MNELPKPPESQPPTSSDDWEDKKASHTNRPVPKSWKWMLAISLVLTVCSSGVAVITYLDNRELVKKFEVTKAEATEAKQQLVSVKKDTQTKVAELEQQLEATEAEATEAKQRLAFAKLVFAKKETPILEAQKTTRTCSKMDERKQLEIAMAEADEAKRKLAYVMRNVQSKVAELEQQLASVIKGVQSKVTELEQQLTLAESSLKEQQLQSAKTSLNDAAKSTLEIKQQLRLLAEEGKVIGLKQAITQ